MSINFYDLILPFTTFYFTTLILNMFFTLNIKTSNLLKSSTTITVKSNLSKNIPNDLILKFSVICVILILTFLFFFRGVHEVIWFNHLTLTNTNIFLILFFNFIFLILYIVFLKLPLLKNLQFEYFFLINLINLYIPLLFLSTNIVTFFFLLEVVSTLILFKFVIGREWELLNNFKKTNFFNFSNSTKSTSYVNIVFFQYWISFFSSVLIVYSLIMFFYLYGSTEFILINYLTNFDLFNNEISNNWLVLITYLSFFLGFFLKLGVAPVHFYKIELYKGLPFITLLIYTIYFFFIFFIYFIFLILLYLNNLVILWYNLGILILFVGVVIAIFLLFDVYSLKAFFAYSTVVNSMLFLALVISLI